MQGLSSSGFPPHRPRFELYCFDLDDTLVQTSRHVSTHLYPQLAERFAFPTPTDQEIAQHWGKPLAESLRALFPGCQNIDALVDTLRQLHMQDPIPAAPRAKTILDILRRHGRHVAVYSSGDPVLVKATLQRSLRVRPKDFAAVYLLAEHGEQKETSGVLDRIRAEVRRRIGISIEPTSVLVVGDDPRDSVLARQGGACFRAVSSGYYNADAYASQGIPKDRVFPDLAAAMAQPVDHGVVGIIQDTYGRFLLVCEGRPDNPYFGYWSGPHGRCVAEDVLEEESVVREVREELGVEIRLIRPVYTRTADTKVRTVTFWLAELADAKQEPKNACPQEISDVRWFDLEAIRSGNLSLYPGTRDFFDRFGAALSRGDP